MEKVNVGDFIKIEFTGRVKPEGYIFDTTSKEDAHKNGIYNPEVTYGPITLCVGKSMVLKGLDDELSGKELGFDGKIVINPEGGFGKKDPKLLKLIPTSKFKAHNITPTPGLQVDIDGMIGFVRTVTGGRTIVDFNHPLSGKDLEYEVKILNRVDDKVEQVSSVLTMKLNMKPDNFVVEISDRDCKIMLKGTPELSEEMSKNISEFIKGCVDVDSVTISENHKEKDNSKKEENNS
ncbi:MAG: FKBP-type peptidyl-prolyl cis-trans isomerase [Nanoarchaeota archaeon]